MLTLLIILAIIWTLYWLVALMRDWNDHRPFLKVPCATCPNASAHAVVVASPAPAASADSFQADKNAVSNDQDNIVKAPVADEHDQVNVKPLFEAPSEKDDLKVIKGIGVVMEKTLNELGITTFKQLAGFQQAEVKMVSDVLSEANSGFGDRIQRDEWVDQAKELVKKAG